MRIYISLMLVIHHMHLAISLISSNTEVAPIGYACIREWRLRFDHLEDRHLEEDIILFRVVVSHVGMVY